MQLADWRRRMAEIYANVRAAGTPEAGWRVWRDGRAALFRTHPQSPIPTERRAGYDGPPLAGYDPAWRFAVPLAPLQEDAPHAADAGEDGALRLTPVGRTIGLAATLGRELTVFWVNGYGGGLFLPFRDATSGESTYGGGRYLLDGVKSADLGTDADGRLILDFNFAYHPSCAHNPRWTCPLAPPENWVEAEAPVGERLPGGVGASPHA